MKNLSFITSELILLTVFLVLSCQNQSDKNGSTKSDTPEKLTFVERKIADSAEFWWAHTPADVDGDGLTDLVFINRNSAGGYLAYYKGQKEDGLWELHIIADTPPTGGLFASGDLETADIDGDGNEDVIGVKHPGEWTDAAATAEIFWYKKTGESWKPHTIGTAPDAVKDMSFTDFDQDGKMDLALLTFDEHTLSVYKQNSPDDWERVQFIHNVVLHEGMDVGDLNGDGFPDIVANAMIYYNPGTDLKQSWNEENLDERWNNQTGDWSHNGTKTFIQDIDGDNMGEIYMAHSERAGYPVVMYQKKGESWNMTTIVDSIPANHTLQVFDFDLDGDYDVLAGPNRARAVNLGKSEFDVAVYLNEGDYKSYKKMVIEENGIYNGRASDYDGDGDIDIFRYPDHEATDFFLLENKLK